MKFHLRDMVGAEILALQDTAINHTIIKIDKNKSENLVFWISETESEKIILKGENFGYVFQKFKNLVSIGNLNFWDWKNLSKRT